MTAGPLYVVVIWNGERTRRKIFKNCFSERAAEESASKLRRWGIDAEIIAVGDASSNSAIA